MEGRLALIERNVRESRRHAQKQKPDPGQDFFNLTLELQSQEERLTALQAQRDELLIGLKGLQDSLKNQALRVTRLEGQLGEVLQWNGGGTTRGLWRAGEPLDSNITPRKYYEPRRRGQTHRGGRPGRILDERTQPRPEGIIYSETDNHSQVSVQSRNPLQPSQFQATPNQPKHSKAQKQTPTDYLAQPYPSRPQSQIQVQALIRPYPIQQEQLQSHQTVPYPHAQIQSEVQQQSQPKLYHQRHHQLHNPSRPSWPQNLSQAPTQPEPNKDKQSRTRLDLPGPQSESYQPRMSGWDGGQEGEHDTKVESSVIHNLLQLPARQKIPARPVPKKDATSK